MLLIESAAITAFCSPPRVSPKRIHAPKAEFPATGTPRGSRRSPAVVLLSLSSLLSWSPTPLQNLEALSPSLKPRPPSPPPGSHSRVRLPHPAQPSVALSRLICHQGKLVPSGSDGVGWKLLCAQPGAGTRPTLRTPEPTFWTRKLTSSKGQWDGCGGPG